VIAHASIITLPDVCEWRTAPLWLITSAGKHFTNGAGWKRKMRGSVGLNAAERMLRHDRCWIGRDFILFDEQAGQAREKWSREYQVRV